MSSDMAKIGGKKVDLVHPQSVVAAKPLDHLAAGFLGGVTSTLILHPLDMVKIRRAAGCDPATAGRGVSSTTNTSSSNLLTTFRRIVRSDGIRGLYRGVTPNVCGAGSSWGLYFVCYESLKQWCVGRHHSGCFTGSHQLAVASASGLVTLIATNPVTVVRTRLCLQPCPAATSGEVRSGRVSGGYSSTLDAVRQTYRGQGARGFYRGFVPGICGVVHGAIQFSAYEQLKALYNRVCRHAAPQAPLSGVEYVACAALSKMLAVAITYPYQVVRACLQDHLASHSSCVDVLRHVAREQGPRGLYRGLAAHLVHVVPNICLVLVVYETVTGSSRTG